MESGLENGEYCLWVVADSFTIGEAGKSFPISSTFLLARTGQILMTGWCEGLVKTNGSGRAHR